MSLTISLPIPIFSNPITKTPHFLSSSTSIQFSRWNNANAAEFNDRRRTQQDIETDIRRHKRFSAADRIAEAYKDGASSEFRSKGSSSVPSRRSIPGKKSKYSEYEEFSRPVFNRFVDDKRESDVRVGQVSSYSENGNFRVGEEVNYSKNGELFVNLGFKDEERESGKEVKYLKNVNNLRSDFTRFGNERESGNPSRVGESSKYTKNVNILQNVNNERENGGGDVAVRFVDSTKYKYSKNGNNLHPAFKRESVRVGKNSKFSKYDKNMHHPAFRRFKNSVEKREGFDEEDVESVRVGEDGVSYVVGNAPFEFRYSYTETPKVKPVRLREPPVAPFGPATMPRPWTGRKPMSKKLLPEFDSFKLPPPHKKGVKPVQSPGPFLPGSGPKYVHSREEILGEPLTKEEIEELVNSCKKSKRQLHIGRDGLTHNMLENIHAHWKRRRVCKIKCLGVCTVDMDNVYEQLEDKTGGKVIYGNGGVIYLFRGRNYNYKTRPRYPLMLWKPTTPVYPRLVKRVPDGLTLEEASEMRKKGRDLIPICKLGKNGVYHNLVENVREAFEACDLVRINCQGMNPSDCRKIGAKLKDLVPCVLISFEREHILMWRGREWTSLLPKLEDNPRTENSEIDVTLSSTPDSEDEGLATSFFSDSEDLTCSPALSEDIPSTSDEGGEIVVDEVSSTEEDVSTSFLVSGSPPNSNDTNGNENLTRLNDYATDQTELSSSPTEGVLSLLKEAIANGAAIVLDDSGLDSDIVFQTAVSLAKSAPRGPVYKGRFRKVAIRKSEKPKTEDTKVEEVLMISDNKGESENKKSYRRQLIMKDIKEDYLDVIPQGSLRVDELAKLLA